MSENNVEITCPRCGHAWPQDLADLDPKDVVVFRGEQHKQYRVRCPRCGTRTIVSVEEDDGETGG